MLSEPYQACAAITNREAVQGKVALAQRGECMFAAKARNLQKAGALGVIFIGESRALLLPRLWVFSSAYSTNAGVGGGWETLGILMRSWRWLGAKALL